MTGNDTILPIICLFPIQNGGYRWGLLTILMKHTIKVQTSRSILCCADKVLGLVYGTHQALLASEKFL
jgi:hypothetical protein